MVLALDVFLVLYGTWSLLQWSPLLSRYWGDSTRGEKCLASFGVLCSSLGCAGAWGLFIYDAWRV